MTEVSFDQDPTQLLLSQLKAQYPRYLHQDYLKRRLLQFEPQQAQIHKKSIEYQLLKEHFDDCDRQRRRLQQVKHSLKTKFFNVRGKRPPTLPLDYLKDEPMEMIKSFSMPKTFYKRNKEQSLARSMMSSGSQKMPSQRQRYSDQVQHLLQNSVVLTQKKNRFRLKGYTNADKQRMMEDAERKEKKEILQLIRSYNFREEKVNSMAEIPNKQKYSLKYMDYQRQKTKNRLDKICYQKKVRKPQNNLQKFQEFILQEVKLNPEDKEELSKEYIKMREQFRRCERQAQRRDHLNRNSKKIFRKL